MKINWEGIKISLKDLWILFSGLFYYKTKKKTIEEGDLDSYQKYQIGKSLILTEQVWNLIYKVYIMDTNNDRGWFVILLVTYLSLKVAMFNIIDSYVHNRSLLNKEDWYKITTFIINF